VHEDFVEIVGVHFGQVPSGVQSFERLADVGDTSLGQRRHGSLALQA
jgi:hypothetical protein